MKKKHPLPIAKRPEPGMNSGSDYIDGGWASTSVNPEGNISKVSAAERKVKIGKYLSEKGVHSGKGRYYSSGGKF